MKLFCLSQQRRFGVLLEKFKQKQVLAYRHEALKKKVSVIALSENTSDNQTDNQPENQKSKLRDNQIAIQDIQLEWLFDYHIFPENILLPATQWQVEGRKIKAGDIILQQINFPPFSRAPLKIICAVKVSQHIDEPHKRGFAYETLRGHVEKGISVFTVEQLTTGSLIFKIQTYSTPATWFARLLAPVFSLPYQAYCTRAALQNGLKSFQKACNKA